MDQARRRRVTEAEWLRHQSLIRRLYLLDWSLKDITMLLEVTEDFSVTLKAQLEYKLKQWDISKNIHGDSWRSIDRCIKKRKQQGKESDVIHCGKRLKQSTIDKETNRHRDTSTFTQYLAESPPQTSSTQIIVCTPEDYFTEFVWPETLPWFSFQDKFQKCLSFHRSHISTSATTCDLEKSLLSLLTLSTMSKDERLHEKHASRLLPTLALNLGKVMPERHPGEHLQTAHVIATSSAKIQMPDWLRIIIFQVSNEMTSFWDFDHWDKFYGLITETGLLDATDTMRTFRQQELTVKAFMDNLFKKLVETICDLRLDGAETFQALVKWLLSSGQDPNICFLWIGRLYTPLERAIVSRQMNMIEQLLVAGADLRITFEHCPHQSFMSLALRDRVFDDDGIGIVKTLLRYCKTLSPEEVLHAAIRLQDWNLFEQALESSADLSVAVPTQSYLPKHSFMRLAGYLPGYEKTDLVYEETALSAAAAVSIAAFRFVLGRLEGQHQFNCAASYVTPDVFISAACAGNTDVVSYLHQINPIGFKTNQHGITPLQAAVKQGHLETCQLLFQLYRESSAILLFITCCSDQLEILRYFLDNGVDVDTTAVPADGAPCSLLLSMDDTHRVGRIFHKQSSTPLDLLLTGSLYKNHQDAIEILIRSGASLPASVVPPFSHYGLYQILSAALDSGGDPNSPASWGATPLECALRGGHLNCAKLLLEKRAKLATANVLQALLPEHICNINGERSRRDPRLKALLLAHGASIMNIGEGSGSYIEAAIVLQDDAQLKKAFSESPIYYSSSTLCSAVLMGRHWIIDVLLTNRPSQAQHDPLEGTAIGLAAKSGNLALVRKLVTQLKKPETALLPFFSPSLLSRDNGLATPSEILFWHRRPCNLVYGSPLALAASCQESDGFSELISQGYHSDTITWARVAGMGAIKCLTALMDHNQRTGILPPPSALAPFLIDAIENKMEEVALCLIESGADPNGHGSYENISRSPFLLAIEHGRLKTVNKLLQAGASINAPPYFYRGATPLQIAAIQGYNGLAKKLLDAGARVNARGARQCGRTALEGAAENGKLDMVQVLLHHGALTTGPGRSQFIRSIQFAERNGYNATAALLRRWREWTDDDSHMYETNRPLCRECPYEGAENTYRVKCLDGYNAGRYCCDEYTEAKTAASMITRKVKRCATPERWRDAIAHPGTNPVTKNQRGTMKRKRKRKRKRD